MHAPSVKQALFVKQDHNSPSGLVGEAFTELGYDITELTVVPAERFRAPAVTASFPDPARYDAIVAFGAVWSAYDDATVGTWIGDEIAFTRAAIDLGIPVLGICFGGQMLAMALGGRVERAPAAEIGWTAIATTVPELVDAGPWLEWHYDRIVLPPGVPPLATTTLDDTDLGGTDLSGTDLNGADLSGTDLSGADLSGAERVAQAFAVGRSMGVQFHPEVTESVLLAWLANGGAEELVAAGVVPAELLAQARALRAGAASRTRKLVRGFVSDVANRPLMKSAVSEVTA